MRLWLLSSGEAAAVKTSVDAGRGGRNDAARKNVRKCSKAACRTVFLMNRRAEESHGTRKGAVSC